MKCMYCGVELTTGDIGYKCSRCQYQFIQRDNIPPLQGWICPRCGKVHSPFISECDCPPPTRTWTGTGTEVIKTNEP
jgi:DNA-directed RNA polymerase subunit RPC12/RpoP